MYGSIKDSGKRQEFATGMKRDTNEGKKRYDLMFPLSVVTGLIDRLADHLANGAKKYEERNWEKASTPKEFARFRESALRHIVEWYHNDFEEDHAAAVVFNLMGAELVRQKLIDKVLNGEALDSHFIDEAIAVGLQIPQDVALKGIDKITRRFSDVFFSRDAQAGAQKIESVSPTTPIPPQYFPVYPVDIPNAKFPTPRRVYSKPFVYLASPYSHPSNRRRRQRYEMASKVAGLLMKQDLDVFSPIAMTTVLKFTHLSERTRSHLNSGGHSISECCHS